jgi:branched-chain amino acid transport system permease protein
MRRYLHLLNGPNTVGNSRIAWALFVLGLIWFLVYPFFGSRFMVSNLTLFALYLPVALGLSLLWGYMGVLSFGQMAFFGIGGYVYGLLSINLQNMIGGTVISMAGGLVATALVAGFFGYFVFYGQVSEWIIPVLTLVFTLVMETFMAQTAGYQWKVGQALLGGYNGMTNIPSLKIGANEFDSGSLSLYYLVFIACTLTYLALRILVNSKWGSIIVAVREDTVRTRMVGHNVNLIQVLVFILSAALAGLSGIFYVSWGNYIDPSTMGLIAATLPVVWVCVGGRQSLLVVIVSTLLLCYIADLLSVYGGQYAFLVNGALLLGVMVFFPQGIFLTLARSLKARRQRPLRIKEPAASQKIKRYAHATVGADFASRDGLILESKNVIKSFGGVNAISGLNFSMKCGELRSLIGPNGAGKSTFFNLLSGLHSVDSGEILFNGQTITKLSPYQRVRQGICLKFQTTRTYQNLTVAENLQIPHLDAGRGAGRNGILQWALETFGLLLYMDAKVKNISHGHQQWLEICLALATEPELLLLDEPTTGMTPEETSRTAEFVKALNTANMSILVVEHDMSFVRQIDSKITVLHHGRLFAEGSLKEIETNQDVRRIYLGD